MELNPINKTKRKRAVNKADNDGFRMNVPEWTKEKRKRLRIAGKEYINSKGETVPEKEPGPDCKCRRKCYEKVPKATRMKLFKGYYALKSHDEQNAYLFGLIRKVPIARKRAEGSTRRTCTFNYYIRVGGQETQVCVKALANIHGVGKSKIHILCEKLGQNVLFPRDERGRHSKMPKKVSDDTVGLVKEHIYNILHSDRARDFLKDEKANNGPDVNITQMHKDFLDTYDPQYAWELLKYDRQQPTNNTNGDYINPCDCPDMQNDYSGSGQTIEVLMDSEGNAHEVITTDLSQVGVNHNHNHNHQTGKKRKVTRDGRPEPLIRQWYYSKIFHDLYTTKEAISLRKRIISWKSSEDFLTVKPVRKQRQPKKVNQTGQPMVVQHVLLPQEAEQQPDGTIHLTQARLSKATNTVPIAAAPQQIQPKKIVQDITLQNFPVKKKPIQVNVHEKGTVQPGIVLETQPMKQEALPIELYRGTTNSGHIASHKLVFQTQSPDVYSIYPMILQDLTPIDGHSVSLAHAQPLQQGQIRTIAPTHFQAAVAQPAGNAVTITTGNLQALGVNINFTPTGAHYTTTNHGIMGYKLE